MSQFYRNKDLIQLGSLSSAFPDGYMQESHCLQQVKEVFQENNRQVPQGSGKSRLIANLAVLRAAFNHFVQVLSEGTRIYPVVHRSSPSVSSSV